MSNRPTLYRSKNCARCGRVLTPEMWMAPVSGSGTGVWCLSCYTFNTGLDKHGNPVAETLSASVLRAALLKEEERQAATQLQKKLELGELILNNIDSLLLLVSEHDLTGCSDEHPGNAYHANCTRCVLLQAEADGFWRNDINLKVVAEYDEKYAS